MNLKIVSPIQGNLNVYKLKDNADLNSVRRAIEGPLAEEVLIQNTDGLHLVAATGFNKEIKPGDVVDFGVIKGTVHLHDKSGAPAYDKPVSERGRRLFSVLGGAAAGLTAGATVSFFGTILLDRSPSVVATSLVMLGTGLMTGIGLYHNPMSPDTQYASLSSFGLRREFDRNYLLKEVAKAEASAKAEAEARPATVQASGQAAAQPEAPAESQAVGAQAGPSRSVSVATKPALSQGDSTALGVAAAEAVIQTAQQIVDPRGHKPAERSPSVIEQIIDPRLAPKPVYEGPSVLQQLIDPKAPKAPAQSGGPSVLRQIIDPKAPRPAQRAASRPSLVNEIFSPRSNPRPAPKSGKSTASKIGSLFGAR